MLRRQLVRRQSAGSCPRHCFSAGRGVLPRTPQPAEAVEERPRRAHRERRTGPWRRRCRREQVDRDVVVRRPDAALLQNRRQNRVVRFAVPVARIRAGEIKVRRCLRGRLSGGRGSCRRGLPLRRRLLRQLRQILARNRAAKQRRQQLQVVVERRNVLLVLLDLKVRRRRARPRSRWLRILRLIRDARRRFALRRSVHRQLDDLLGDFWTRRR